MVQPDEIDLDRQYGFDSDNEKFCTIVKKLKYIKQKTTYFEK